MPGANLWGWNSGGNIWTKLLCNADGELLIDGTAIFEDTPTDGELEKGPTSNWAFDHNANVAAHHSKYTDAEARGSIGNILDSNGVVTSAFNSGFNRMYNIWYYDLMHEVTDTYMGRVYAPEGSPYMRFLLLKAGVGYVDCDLVVYRPPNYYYVTHQANFQSHMAVYLEETPSDGVVNKAPTSNWAYDHENLSTAHHTPPVAGDFNHQDLANRSTDDHHAKYTDAEAQAACNLSGNLYLTIPGISFRPGNPNSDAHSCNADGSLLIRIDGRSVRCPCMLPDGSTITAVLVDGNAGASSQAWTLNRVTLADMSSDAMATADVQTEDVTISYGLIDNSLYMYVITIAGLDTNDLIYYTRITYTL